MPTEPKGQKCPADVISNAIKVMRIATGEETEVPGVPRHPPHDYGVAVILYGLADHGVVPLEQVNALRQGIATFLLASQQAMVDPPTSERTFREALPHDTHRRRRDGSARASRNQARQDTGLRVCSHRWLCWRTAYRAVGAHSGPR